MLDFADKNIIYGWNYSGKTTLSRLFHALELRQSPVDYPDAQFIFGYDGGNSVTESTLGTFPKTVAVFNSDFVEKNISWNGQSFQPVLLLGEDSIGAQNQIAELEKLVERCRKAYKIKKDRMENIEAAISDKKTKAAKEIRLSLSLVETFTATHLSSLLNNIGVGLSRNFVLTQEDVSRLTKAALSSDADKLDAISKVQADGNIGSVISKCVVELDKIPQLSNTIEHLRDNPEIASWIESGLHLHEGAEACEFCGNPLAEGRMKTFREHFSTDLADFRKSLRILNSQVDACRIRDITLQKSSFYSHLREEVEPIISELKLAIATFNAYVDALSAAVKHKQGAPFEKVACPAAPPDIDKHPSRAADKLNSVILKHNEITANFGKEKINALATLKLHYAAEFAIRENLDRESARITVLRSHLKRYQSFAEDKKTKIAGLKAKIDRAQKGSEEINARLLNLLGSNQVQIDVVKDAGGDRFRLVRNGAIAKNLSEGEKTAIAFSFFLAKLKELPNFDDAIVFIDDPISSLDSNHVFQVNAIIKDYFFEKVGAAGEWKTRCKQIFISTHNFEFFSLLKELPGNQNKTRYYQVKRISASESSLTNLPVSLAKYSSEYHYLFSIIYSFHNSQDKADLGVLLGIPNAVRRFVELYTYAKIPSAESVDFRAEVLFGSERSKRILKVLHYFSHGNNIERISKNTDLICDIEGAVADLMAHVKEDALHFNALEAAFAKP
ncbi:AAA family ATPase [Burkholderia multivorans]|uniref:AAA family ATPase n=1 Tax=Burkholderia multivorans TaxID=87883 RepID=UPI0018C8BF03|nr:AAA family ATPase [Burkholderia multivorans]MBU9415471.1 AAA family ATPase [Burkholderia multivorans]